MTANEIVIVGAGATGTLLACHLLARRPRPITLHLVERTGCFAQGAAYAARLDIHTLNVMAKLMGGAEESDTDGFIRFAASHLGVSDPAELRDRYLPRALYGGYLRHLLTSAERNAGSGATLHRIADEALDVERMADGRFRVELAAGGTVHGDLIALCLGNLDPAPLSPALPSRRMIDAPWRPGALDAIAAQDRVAIIGTGLTMVDTVLELTHRGHRGPITAFSRRGLVPATDAFAPAYPDFFDPALACQGIVAVLRAVRAEVARANARDVGWHAVIEAFRVHASAIWQALDDTNRRRFLRHLRTPWLSIRHRLPPQHARVLDRLKHNKSAIIFAARLVEIAETEPRGALAVAIRRHRAKRDETIHADWLVNCIGPESDYERARLPLLRNLLRRGLIRPDPYRLGLDIAKDFTVIGRDGAPVPGLVALGPPTRGHFWEVTAVPHLRRQVERFVAEVMA